MPLDSCSSGGTMPEQQFCLKWSNFHSNMSEVFHNMLQSESMVDVTIACEGASLKAHKMILAACSPFFQSLFMSNPCKHPIVILKDVRFVDLKATIDFMYKGEVSVSQSQLGSVLKAAETLKIKGLTDVVEAQRGPMTRDQIPIHPPKKRKKNRKHKSHDGFSPSVSGDESSNDADNPGSSDSRSFGHKSIMAERGEKEEMCDSHLSPADTSNLTNQSVIATDVTSIDNGQEEFIIAADHDTLIEQQSLRQITYDDSSQHHNLPLVGGTSELSQLVLGRRLMMSDSHKNILKDFLDKPIAYFDVVIDDWKKSIVWNYFGKLVYKDPESGNVNVIDNDRHYCLKCIIDSQEKNQDEIFERCNVCFLSNGTATGNHKNHLRQRHQIVDESSASSSSSSIKLSASCRGNPQKARKRTSKVMTISLDEMVHIVDA